ncbi:hypothetical protein RK21_02702 [Pseudomonas plecoglossicida]|nr:hypothetical protein RK21_02702 [Pseudomonas plecoglossicida]
MLEFCVVPVGAGLPAKRPAQDHQPCIQSAKTLLTMPCAYDIGNRRCVLRQA